MKAKTTKPNNIYDTTVNIYCDVIGLLNQLIFTDDGLFREKAGKSKAIEAK